MKSEGGRASRENGRTGSAEGGKAVNSQHTTWLSTDRCLIPSTQGWGVGGWMGGRGPVVIRGVSAISDFHLGVCILIS